MKWKKEEHKLISSGEEWVKIFGVISDFIFVLDEDFSLAQHNAKRKRIEAE